MKLFTGCHVFGIRLGDGLIDLYQKNVNDLLESNIVKLTEEELKELELKSETEERIKDVSLAPQEI